MVMRTVEIGLEVDPDSVDKVIRKIRKLYPDLEVFQDNGKVMVKGNLSNYKKRSMIMWILSGGKHGKNIQAS